MEAPEDAEVQSLSLVLTISNCLDLSLKLIGLMCQEQLVGRLYKMYDSINELITGDGGDCTYDLNSLKPMVGMTGYNSLTPNDEAAVMQHIAEVGPLAIALDASGWGSYQGGVFDGCSFDENISINHGVQLVGYGTEYGPA